MNRIIFKSIFLVCLFTLQAYSQGPSDNDLVNKFLVPNAPKAASTFNNNVNVSNNLYTKTKNINIPIYSFGSKEIQVPISLNLTNPFYRKGMKDTEVGHWWNLKVGGEISRNIYGKADEIANGYFESYSKIINAENLSKADFDNGINNKWDTSPDEFFFDFNGIQGRFMFDHNKIIHIDSESDLKIFPTFSQNNREILSFLIIDDNGFTYHFGENDNAIEEIASKTITYIKKSLPAGLLVEGTSNGFKVHNFIPNFSNNNWNPNPLIDPYTGQPISFPGNTSIQIVSEFYTDILETNEVTLQDNTQLQNELDEEPVNIAWKLIKIESPNKTDFIDFEYDSGGWVEYQAPVESTTYKYRISEDISYLPLTVLVSIPSPLTGGGLYNVLYPGNFYTGRPDYWSINYNNLSLNRLPIVKNNYLTTVYKKTSSLVKIKNKYDEYINFNYSSTPIKGFEGINTENYGNPYSLKYLRSISRNNELFFNTYLYNYSTFSALFKIKLFDKFYKFDYDETGVNVSKITYPTGGYVKFFGDGSEEVYSPENGSLITSYEFLDAENYKTPTNEVKYGYDWDSSNSSNASSYIDQINTNGNYRKIYSHGVNKVYGTVKKYIDGKLQSTHRFTTPSEKKDDKNKAYERGTSTNSIANGFHTPPPSTRDYERGIEKTRIQFNPQSDITKTVSENKIEHQIETEIKAVRLTNRNLGNVETSPGNSRAYSHYSYYFPIKKSSNSTNSSFFKEGKTIIEKSNVEYDTNFYNNNNISKVTETDSNNDEIIKKYKYPYSIADNISYSPTLNDDGVALRLMNTMNLNNVPIEESVYKKKDGSPEELLLASNINFFRHYAPPTGGLHIYPNRLETIEESDLLNDYLPINISQSGSNYYLSKDSRLKTKVNYERFDSEGNLLQSRNEDDIPISYIWGYKNRFIVAKIVGTQYQDIVNTLGNSSLTTINNSTDNVFIRTTIQTLRNQLSESEISTYTYIPNIQKLESMTDEKGLTTFFKYKYDRLMFIIDSDGKIIKEYKYNLKIKY